MRAIMTIVDPRAAIIAERRAPPSADAEPIQPN